MIETKLFEVRDARTFIPVAATLLRTVERNSIGPTDREEAERYLLRRIGFLDEGPLFVILTSLVAGRSAFDPHEWNSPTMNIAHLHILENWSRLASGDVVDVEYILGKTAAPKPSERLTPCTGL